VILQAGLLPGRAYAAGLIGRARRARRPAEQLRVIGVRAVVALDPGLLPARVLADPLGCALDALGAAAVAMGRRFGLEETGLWERIVVLTRGQLLNLAPDGCPGSAVPGSRMPACGRLGHQGPPTGPELTADPAPCPRRRHLAHDAARNVRFLVNAVSAAEMVIFSVA
jgi:hypothetical protein